MTETGRSLVIIPTYNEAENLEPLISAVQALGAGLELLIIDDNSPDGTGQIADRLSQEREGLHVLHRRGKLGLGTAYIEGFRWAIEHDYDYVFEMDCDFSHHPRYLPTFLERITGADLVIGSRYIRGGDTPDWGLLRRFISWGGNTYARFMLRLKTNDCTSGYRCYRREMLARVPWDEIPVQGYGFQIAAVFHVERLGGVVAEFPIVFEDRRVGRSKMSSKIVLEALVYVTRLAFSKKAPSLGSGSGATR